MWHWFWQGPRARELREQRASTRVLELSRRARVALELATHAEDPREPLRAGDAKPLAAELRREAAYWALRAYAENQGAVLADNDGLNAVAKLVPQELLDSAFEADAAVQLSELELTPFQRLSDLDPVVMARFSDRAERFTRILLNVTDAPAIELERLWLRRLLRVGAIGALLGLTALTAIKLRDWQEDARDLAKGRAYRVSSGALGCRSPEQECSESPFFFFHTAEEDKPWVEIDLGLVRTVSGVRLVNRTDCCTERGTPLVIELSVDQQNFREVAKQTNEFRSVKLEFPTSRARFVRVRALNRTILHLQRVRVLP
ncbi:MAG TPA: discoidin domain-containing protein [Polyangiaceae bacterium]|nr:discoidin domain-containing protein [Polyangiaceae bacterium]